MSPPAGPADRHEPLPGVFGLPGHFLRKLSPRGRKLAAAIGVMLLAAAITATIILAPQISESKRERAAQERREHARALAREVARLRAEQRPRSGRVAVGGAAALVTGIEHAITRDAQARAAAGEFDQPARRTDCHAIGRTGGRLALACTAVTSDVGPNSGTSSGVLIGFPYRAAASPESGRYAFCKTSGHPGEGLHSRERMIELPHACGGGL